MISMGKSGRKKSGKERFEKWLAKYDPAVVAERFREVGSE
jgi:hypothetical protein